MIKYIKSALFIVIVGYTVLFSFLFIRKSYDINQYINKTYDYINISQYEKTMEENKNKLDELTIFTTDNKSKTCLTSIDKLISMSYKNYYRGSTLIKDEIDNYYESTDTLLDKYGVVINNCDISSEIKDITNPIIISNISMVEKMYNDILMSYQLSFVDKNSMAPSFHLLIRKSSKINEANIIKLILKEVGDRYEQ